MIWLPIWTSLPPLCHISTGKSQHWVYSEPEEEEVLSKLKEAKKVETQLHKGPGRMSSEQLLEITMTNIATRTKLDHPFQYPVFILVVIYILGSVTKSYLHRQSCSRCHLASPCQHQYESDVSPQVAPCNHRPT